jgi:hypothetical protein
MNQTLRKYYLFVKEQPCLACGKTSTLVEPSEADHITAWSNKLKGFGIRSHNGIAAYFCVPLCRECHQERHKHPEQEWYESRGWPRTNLYAYLAHQLASFLTEESGD